MGETDELELVHQNDEAAGGFYLLKDGEKLGEMVYRKLGDGVLLFHHTWVDDSLRGQGRARQLLDAAMGWVRKTGQKVTPTCSYVKSQFEKDPSLADLRA